MIKKSRILLVIVLIIIIPIASYLISISDRDLSESRYEEILQMIIESPDSVVIKQDEVDITKDFLNKYQDLIEDENYTEAIEFLKEEQKSITIQINNTNQMLLQD